MSKAIIVYESKYGNTGQVAAAIGEGMREAKGIEATLVELKNLDLNSLAEYDVVLIGTPTHFGMPTRKIKKFIDHLGKLNLGAGAAVFDTYLGNDFEKSVKKMEQQLAEKATGIKVAAPGLSVLVNGMKGPIAEGELAKAQEFGARVAAAL